MRQALLTAGSGSSLWPTTTTKDAAASGAAGYSTDSGRHPGTTLTDAAVRRPLWATPATNLHNYDEAPASFMARRLRLKEKGTNGNGAGVPLGVEAQLWATTTARDWRDGACAGADVPTNALLGRQVLRTPWDGGSTSLGGRVLSPRFAETLMGWPTDWTASGSRATVSSPRRPPSPSRRWLAAFY